MVCKRKRQRHRKINVMNMANNSSPSGPNPILPGSTQNQSQTSRSSSSPRRKPSFGILQAQKPNQQLPPHQGLQEEPPAGIANQPSSSQDMFGLSPDIVHLVDDDDDDVELQQALFYSSMLSGKQKALVEEEVIDVKQKGILRQSFTLTYNPTISFGTTSFHNSSVTGRGDSSVSFMENCVICNDAKPYYSDLLLQAFKCSHRFCEDCIKKYVSEKLQESIHESIMCPESKCEKPLGENFWMRLVPERLVEQWHNARIESSVLAQPLLLWCPFEDCSKSFVDDEKQFLIRACPHCWRIFCLRCQVSWHLGMTCAEFQQRLREEQIEREISEIRQFQGLFSHRGPVVFIG